MDYTIESPAILSLCTGMRGLERGIERAIGSINTVAFVEIESFIIENLVRQMEQGVLATAPIWSNLKTFPSEQFYGKIHGITGGYPCQPFSVAGKRNGTEDPRHLWPYIKSMVGTIRPVWCFFENVTGHLTLGYREVRSDLEQLGYKVEEGIFSAEEVGAPHQRKRLFILAVANSFREWQSQPEGGKSAFRKRTINGSEVVDNSSGNRQQSHNEISARRDSADYAGEELADSAQQRMEGNWPEGKQESAISTGETLPRRDSRRDQWPAKPGQEQYEWEAPRVESSVGFTVNGYNFREDLLRMAGNGVVEQVAELAWKTLWNKS